MDVIATNAIINKMLLDGNEHIIEYVSLQTGDFRKIRGMANNIMEANASDKITINISIDGKRTDIHKTLYGCLITSIDGNNIILN